MKIPEQSRGYEDVLEAMSGMGNQDLDYRAGKSWSLVYYVDDAFYAFLKCLPYMSA